MILYKWAVKELTKESENRRKELVWALGTAECRINPGHGLEKEREKGRHIKRSYRKQGGV